MLVRTMRPSRWETRGKVVAVPGTPPALQSEARELERRLSDGRPCGSAPFVQGLEKRFGRRLTAGKPGRPRKRRGKGQ